jgi:hypothetical protein
MTTFIPTAILLLSLAGGYGTTGVSSNPAAVVSSDDETQTIEFQADGEAQENVENLLLRLQSINGMSRQDRVLRTAFVVPGPDLKPEGIGQISEDLTVMCRIFDKAAVWAGRMGAGEAGARIPVDISTVELPNDLIMTQSLYLDGYGAIFFLPVDFPLAAPPQEQTVAKTEASADPLWSQTANELRGVPQQSRRTSAPQYSAQRVENLKAALIGTLRHAANLRTRRAEDAINIVIATRSDQGGRRGWAFRGLRTDEYGDPLTQPQTAVPTWDSPELPTVLILRTTKADVDALAKGGLSQEQFAGKVQILKSWTSPIPVGGAGGYGGSRGGGYGGGYGTALTVPSTR